MNASAVRLHLTISLRRGEGIADSRGEENEFSFDSKKTDMVKKSLGKFSDRRGLVLKNQRGV